MGKIGGDLYIDNYAFLMENIRGSYSDNCDKIHGGFLEIAKVYKESNNLVLGMMNEIAYDALVLAMTRAIRSVIAHGILNNKPAAYFFNRTGMLLVDITNNLDTHDAVLSNLSKYREFDPKYMQKLKKQY